MRYHDQLKLSFIFIFLLLILTSTLIGREIYNLSGLQMDMDEAVHANRGLDMASDIRGNAWGELWLDFSKPEWYPSGHGVLSGVWLLIFSPKIETARLYSTFLYMLFGMVLWFSIREMIPDAKPFLYLIPPLFLITDELHIVHAGMAMLEIPSITFAFAGLLFLNRARCRKRLIDHFLTLFFGLLCLFTKYNYGLVLFTVYAICHALIALDYFPIRRKPLQDTRNMRYILFFWGIFALVVILWFLVPGSWTLALVCCLCRCTTRELFAVVGRKSHILSPKVVDRITQLAGNLAFNGGCNSTIY